MREHLEHGVTLVIGGARSGKSSYAETLGCSLTDRPIYLATAEITDEEMRLRIERHRKQREGKFSLTVEEPLELATALEKIGPSPVVLVDCVTVWMGNLLYHEGLSDRYRQVEELLDYCTHPSQRLLIVSNEVGSGIVPADPMSRHFRDHAGWLNQSLARIADTVVWVVAGIPVTIKGA